MNDDIRSQFAAMHELVAEARRRLDPIAWDYLVGGGGTETTLRRNRLALDSLAFRPRILRNVADIDPGVALFGRRIAMPVTLAPVGSVHSFDPEGIAAAARAAGRAHIAIMAGGIHPDALPDMAQGTDGPKIFQPYLHGESPLLSDLIEQATDAGCDAFCMTVDGAQPGRRERDLTNRYIKPYAKGYDPPNATLSWDDVKRYKDLTGLPLILKGIATAEDAAIAVEHSVDIIYVSNHGGRQLDHGRGGIEVLPEVVAAVKGRAKIWFDGGVSRGADVVKAMILGADMVGIGRLYCYGLAAAGQAGLERMLELLREEICETLGLLGVTRFADLDTSYLCPAAPLAAPYSSAFPLLEPGDPARARPG